MTLLPKSPPLPLPDMYVQEERILRYIYIYKLLKCTLLHYKMTRIFDPKFSPSKAQWLSLIDLVENLHKCSKHLEYLET